MAIERLGFFDYTTSHPEVSIKDAAAAMRAETVHTRLAIFECQ